jgi:RND superfamily putative drug exporter
MPRLTQFLLRHKLAVVAAWLVVLVAGGAAAGAVPSRLSQEFSFPGQEGYEANVAILETYGNGGPGNPLVPVVTLPAGTTVDGQGVAGALERAFDGVAADPRLRVLAWPATTDDRRLVTDGGRTVYGLVWGPFQGPEGGDPAMAEALGDGLRRALPAGTEVQVTGLDALRTAAATEPAGTGVLVETLAGGLGALVVLAFVFGSFLALVPLLIAAVAILTTFLAVLGLTGLVEVSFIVQFLVALIGLGVAVDYSLLVVTRWREELAAGQDREQAVHRAMATAGRAVVTSGGTVAVGLLALVLLPVPFLRSIGYAGLLIPLAATLATLTLLPVLLATIGPRLDWPAGRRARRRDPARAAGGRWTGWAAGVARHRWPATLAALAVLVPLGVAALGLRLGEPPAEVLAQSGPAREALDRLERAGVGSGALTPIEVLLPAGTDRQAAAQRLDGVAGVQLSVAPPGRPGSARGPRWSASCPRTRRAATPARRPCSGSATWPPQSCRGPGSGAAAPWPSTPPAACTAASRCCWPRSPPSPSCSWPGRSGRCCWPSRRSCSTCCRSGPPTGCWCSSGRRATARRRSGASPPPGPSPCGCR